MSKTLVQGNQSAHERMEAQCLSFLEAAVSGEKGRALVLLEGFERSVNAHMRIEEGELFALFLTHAPSKKMTKIQVDGDHTILHRTLAAVRRVLLEGTGGELQVRRHVVKNLEVFSRLKGVLEHHTSREQRDFYPLLDAALDARTRDDLATRLVQAVSHPDAATPT